MCLYPKLIHNPKYKANNKNGGIIPPVYDERVKAVPIGCGNCMECRKKKSREWNVRLHEEIKSNNTGKFITLTFNQESYNQIQTKIYEKSTEKNTEIPTGYKLDNEVATYAIRHFLERWRKKYKRSLRHWLITELGHNGTERIHLHGIVWTQDTKGIVKHWQYGIVTIGKTKFWPTDYEKANANTSYVNEKTINYITKYVTKQDGKHTAYKSIILTSPGIGNNYTKGNGDWAKNKYNGKETKETYRTRQGNKLALPIYYRNKIYSEEEREALWLQKLDKEERWINGRKIKIKDNELEYVAALKQAQKENKELGYGSDKQNWKQEEYEYQRRILIQGLAGRARE